MKTNLIGIISILFSLTLLSCANSVSTQNETRKEIKNDKKKSITFKRGTYSYDIPNETTDVVLNFDVPVDVFIVKMNMGEGIVYGGNNTKYLNYKFENADKESEKNNRTVITNDYIKLQPSSKLDYVYDDKEYVTTPYNRSIIAPSESNTKSIWIQSGHGIGEISKENTKDELYIKIPGEDDHDPSQYEIHKKFDATLLNSGSISNVWFINNNDKSNISELDIKARSQEILNKFEKIVYPEVRNLFGEESNTYADSNKTPLLDTKVNIVLFDIAGDSHLPLEQQTGIIGFFWNKDYHHRKTEIPSVDDRNAVALYTSNEGKYFYIDSKYVIEQPEEIFSALAHEFQHMIDYSEKTIKKGLRSSVWYNELKSVICEDLMQEKLGIPPEKSLRKRRMKDFVENYYKVGLTDWGNSTTSYANAFSFGAFLSRNYDTVEHDIVKQMARNNYVDIESINKALQSCGYPNETFDTLFIKFPQVLLLNNINDSSSPTLNKQKGNLSALDISPYGSCTYFNPEKNGTQNIQPHGFTIHKIGSYSSKGNITLSFDGNTHKDEKLLIIVRPKI